MSDHLWVRITTCDNIPPREGRAVTVAGREIALFNLGDRFLAIDNRCPHRGGPLSDGIVTGSSVVCPLHAWKVNLGTGGVERPAGIETCVATYPTRVGDDGVVVVGLPPHAGSTEQDAGGAGLDGSPRGPQPCDELRGAPSAVEGQGSAPHRDSSEDRTCRAQASACAGDGSAACWDNEGEAA